MYELDVIELPNYSVKNEQRLSRVQEWLKGLELLHESVEGDIKEKVGVTKDFINDNYFAAIPVSTNYGREWGLRSYNRGEEQDIGILALFMSDAKVHPIFEDHLDTIVYIKGSRSIFLPPRRITPIWKGVLAYHEITHAQNHTNETYFEVENSQWVEEVDVFRDESEVLSQIYGADYDSVVEELTMQFIEDLEKDDFNARSRDPLSFDKNLDSIMGPSYSYMEKDLKYAATSIDALLKAFDSLNRTDHHYAIEWLYTGAYTAED